MKHYKKSILVLSFLFLVSCSSATDASQDSPASSQEISSAMPAISSEAVSSEMDTSSEPAQATPLKTATLSGIAHDVSGTVHVYENGTLELLNFSYDGAAPDVYVAFGSMDENGIFQYEILATALIEGEYNNETVVLPLEDGVDSTAYTAVSIWCHEFSEDFGSASFQ